MLSGFSQNLHVNFDYARFSDSSDHIATISFETWKKGSQSDVIWRDQQTFYDWICLDIKWSNSIRFFFKLRKLVHLSVDWKLRTV